MGRLEQPARRLRQSSRARLIIIFFMVLSPFLAVAAGMFWGLAYLTKPPSSAAQPFSARAAGRKLPNISMTYPRAECKRRNFFPSQSPGAVVK